MKSVKVNDLKATDKVAASICHESGVLLVRRGTPLTEHMVDALEESGFDSFFMLEEGETPRAALMERRFETIPTDSLIPGTKLATPLHDDQGKLVLEAGMTLSQGLIDSLKRRGFDTVRRQRAPEELHLNEGEQLARRLGEIYRQELQPGGKPPKPGTLAPTVLAPEVVKELAETPIRIARPNEMSLTFINNVIETYDGVPYKPEGPAFQKRLQSTPLDRFVSNEEKQEFTDVVTHCLRILRDIYAIVTEGKKQRYDAKPVLDVATKSMSGLIQNRELMMLCSFSPTAEDYFVRHALATAVMASNIAAAMGYGDGQVKSLAAGALLANIGMLRLPQGMLDKPDRFNTLEQSRLRQHPVMGLEILQKFRGIPIEVPFIIYQSHEKPNGSGYPCGKTHRVIHVFAQIIHVAKSFTAMCIDRPYRKAMGPYEATRELLFLSKSRDVSSDVVRNLLFCNSLYGVGSFVEIAGLGGGRVIRANPKDYMRPVVTMLWTKDNTPVKGPKRIDLAKYRQLKISKVMDGAMVTKFLHTLVGF